MGSRDFWLWKGNWVGRGLSVNGVVTLCDGEAHYDDDAALYYIIMSQKGDTSLAWASYNGHLEVVKVLLIAGADKEAKDKVGGNGEG